MTTLLISGMTEATAKKASGTGGLHELSAHHRRRAASARPAHHDEPPGEAQRAEQSPAQRDLRGARTGRSRWRCLDLDFARRRPLLLGWLRSLRRQPRRPALSLGL